MKNMLMFIIFMFLVGLFSACGIYKKPSISVKPSTFAWELKVKNGHIGGVLVYQEQSMRIAQKIACFNLQQADELRKAIGKKKADLMAQNNLKKIYEIIGLTKFT